jgi:peptide/nickel transport system substrate-binding protein
MPRIMHHLAGFVFLVLLSGILAACQSQSAALPSPTATLPEPTATSEPRTFVYCTGNAPESLYLYAGGLTEISADLIWHTIYDGPIDQRNFDYQPVILEKLPSLADGDAQLQPVTVSAGDQVVDASGSPVALAAGVRIRPSGCQSDDCALDYDGTSDLEMDQLSATFQLLPGLTWSDGAPLTAADSVYSYKLAADPATPDVEGAHKTTIERTASYTALDDLRAEWVGLPGYLDSAYFLNFWSPLPQHLWGDYSSAELLEAEVSTRKPVGWGAYVIQEEIPDQSITLTRNVHYFRAEEGLPHFERLVFRLLHGDSNTNLESLLNGECDALDHTILSLDETRGMYERLVELDASGQIQTNFTVGTSFNHLDFGIRPQSYDDGWQPGDRPDFFGDVRTRRAFALCMDRQRMAEAANAPGLVLDTYLPPQHPLYNPEVRHYDFDVAAGSALLEEAGWVMGADGVRVYAGENPRIPPGTRFSVMNDANLAQNREAMDIMVASLAECGIEVNVTYWVREDLHAVGPEGIVWGRNFELTQFRWFFGADPPCFLYLSEQIPGEDPQLFPFGYDGSNNMGFQDPEYDQACRAALHSLPGQPGYVENHMKAQQIFAEQLPMVPLWPAKIIAVTRPDFCGQILDPSENINTWNVEAFDYGPDC